MTETSCFMDQRDNETTHYLKPPQAYITTTVFVGTIRRKTHNSKQSSFPQKHLSIKTSGWN